MTEKDHHFDAAVGLVPGAFVRHKTESDWGIGQIQSAEPGRLTVNFEHMGKVVLMDSTLLVAAEPE